MKTGSDIVKTVTVSGVEVDVVGCYDDKTPSDKYDFYDLFIRENCINEGSPLDKLPTKKTIAIFVKDWKSCR